MCGNHQSHKTRCDGVPHSWTDARTASKGQCHQVEHFLGWVIQPSFWHEVCGFLEHRIVLLVFFGAQDNNIRRIQTHAVLELHRVIAGEEECRRLVIVASDANCACDRLLQDQPTGEYIRSASRTVASDHWNSFNSAKFSGHRPSDFSRNCTTSFRMFV